MNISELVEITKKLREINIPDETAQNYLGAAIINLDLVAERVRSVAIARHKLGADGICSCGLPASQHIGFGPDFKPASAGAR